MPNEAVISEGNFASTGVQSSVLHGRGLPKVIKPPLDLSPPYWARSLLAAMLAIAPPREWPVINVVAGAHSPLLYFS